MTPIKPIKPESPKVTNLANHCHDLNSSDLTRRNIFVDGAWIKEQWMSIKSWLTLKFADFNRSSQMFGRDEADVEWMSSSETKRWIYHYSSISRRHPQVTTYAYGVFDEGDFWGKLHNLI